MAHKSMQIALLGMLVAKVFLSKMWAIYEK